VQAENGMEKNADLYSVLAFVYNHLTLSMHTWIKECWSIPVSADTDVVLFTYLIGIHYFLVRKLVSLNTEKVGNTSLS